MTTTTTTTTTTTEHEPPKRARRRRKTRGSIYKRNDGRWCAQLELAGGRRKYIYGQTEADVETKLTAAKSTIDAGGRLVDERFTVTDLVDAFLEERTNRVRPGTLDNYRHYVDFHIKPHIGKLTVARFTADDVQAFANRRVREGASASTVSYTLIVLRMAFRLAVSRRRVMFNPTEGVHGPKVERNVGAPLDAADAQKLIEAARAHRLGAMWILGAALGLRFSEIAGLRWRDVDLKAGHVTIRHQLFIARAAKGEVGHFGERAKLTPPKTKRALRRLALSAAVVAELKVRKATQAAERLKAGEAWSDSLGLIFTCPRGQPLDRGSHSKEHRALCDAAGVRRVRFHDLRHGAATLMLAAGVDPAALSAALGHSRVAFTLDTYVHVTSPRVDDAVGRLADVLSLTANLTAKPA
jgi:integrase